MRRVFESHGEIRASASQRSQLTGRRSHHEDSRLRPRLRRIAEMKMSRAEAEKIEGRQRGLPKNSELDPAGNDHDRADRNETQEYRTSFPATAMTQKYTGLRRFQIQTELFEDRTRAKLEEGKTYAISGEIEGISEFRKIHTGGFKGEFMAIYAPREKMDSIVEGEKYNLHVRSVEEVSRSPERLGTFHLTPYLFPGGEGKLRFDLTTSSLEKRSGVKLEEGKIYDVKGKIGDSYTFEQKHRAHEGTPHIFIWIPKEHAGEFKLGEKHELTVISVTEQQISLRCPKAKSAPSSSYSREPWSPWAWMSSQ